jgi:hypothetical protein
VISRAHVACFGVSAALGFSAAGAQTSDPGARALLERQQQSDAFSLQLQQWMQQPRALGLPQRERQALDALHHDQQLRQSDSFYRQQIQQLQTQQATEPGNGLREAEAMRFQQDRLQDLSRWRWQAEQAAPGGGAAEPPLVPVQPGIVTAPVPRGPRRAAPQPTDAGP